MTENRRQTATETVPVSPLKNAENRLKLLQDRSIFDPRRLRVSRFSSLSGALYSIRRWAVKTPLASRPSFFCGRGVGLHRFCRSGFAAGSETGPRVRRFDALDRRSLHAIGVHHFCGRQRNPKKMAGPSPGPPLQGLFQSLNCTRGHRVRKRPEGEITAVFISDINRGGHADSRIGRGAACCEKCSNGFRRPVGIGNRHHGSG